MRVSTSTKASMLACGSCRPRIHTTSVRDGSTVSGQPPRPEEPEQPNMGLFQTPARRGSYAVRSRRAADTRTSVARVGRSTEQEEVGAQSLVGLRCPAIAAYEHLTRATSSRGDQRIVRGAATDSELNEAGNEGSVVVRVQCHVRVWEAIGKKVPHQGRGSAGGWWQSGQHRERLYRAMRDQARAAVDDAISGVMQCVPRGECRDDNAGIDHRHRRMRSSVSLTISAVSVGKVAEGTATRPCRRRSRRISTGAISISRRPSRTSSSSTCPGCTPNSSRSALGTTMRPAASMVVRMARSYHAVCHNAFGQADPGLPGRNTIRLVSGRLLSAFHSHVTLSGVPHRVSNDGDCVVFTSVWTWLFVFTLTHRGFTSAAHGSSGQRQVAETIHAPEWALSSQVSAPLRQRSGIRLGADKRIEGVLPFTNLRAV